MKILIATVIISVARGESLRKRHELGASSWNSNECAPGEFAFEGSLQMYDPSRQIGEGAEPSTFAHSCGVAIIATSTDSANHIQALGLTAAHCIVDTSDDFTFSPTHGEDVLMRNTDEAGKFQFRQLMFNQNKKYGGEYMRVTTRMRQLLNWGEAWQNKSEIMTFAVLGAYFADHWSKEVHDDTQTDFAVLLLGDLHVRTKDGDGMKLSSRIASLWGNVVADSPTVGVNLKPSTKPCKSATPEECLSFRNCVASSGMCTDAVYRMSGWGLAHHAPASTSSVMQLGPEFQETEPLRRNQKCISLQEPTTKAHSENVIVMGDNVWPTVVLNNPSNGRPSGAQKGDSGGAMVRSFDPKTIIGTLSMAGSDDRDVHTGSSLGEIHTGQYPYFASLSPPVPPVFRVLCTSFTQWAPSWNSDTGYTAGGKALYDACAADPALSSPNRPVVFCRPPANDEAPVDKFGCAAQIMGKDMHYEAWWQFYPYVEGYGGGQEYHAFSKGGDRSDGGEFAL